MIGCSMVESVRSDKQAQKELENETLYTPNYTTGASEHQLPFRVDGMAAGDTKKKQSHKEKHGLPLAGLACRYDLL
jgi:hypothetical protein